MTLLKLVPLGDGPAITFTAAAPVQPGPSHPDDDPAYAGTSRRRSYNSPLGLFRHSSRQGSDTLPRKRMIRLPMRARRLHIADTGTISRMTRNISVILLWLFCWTTSCECFQQPPILGPAFPQTISRLRGCQYSG